MLQKDKEGKKGQRDKKNTRIGAHMAHRVIGSSKTDRGKTTAVLMAKVNGHFVFCRIDLWADSIAVLVSVIKFLYNNAFFFPTIQFKKKHTFKAIYGRTVESSV